MACGPYENRQWAKFDPLCPPFVCIETKVCQSLVYTVEYYKAIENNGIDLYLLTWKDIHSKLLREKIMYNITIYCSMCVYIQSSMYNMTIS